MRQKILLTFALLLAIAQGAWADDKADYGVLNGEFSVSAIKKVHFSRGNLRAFYYSSESWEWYFSTNQYDYVGNGRRQRPTAWCVLGKFHQASVVLTG